MATKRKSIRLDAHERHALIALYVEKAIPIDQYDERRRELDDLLDKWSALTGRTNVATDLLHYMRNQRKNGTWVRLDGNHVARESRVKLPADETEALVAIYREHVSSIEHGSDSIGYDDEIADLIAKEFSAETERVIPASDLVAALTALRKRGLLPKIEKCNRDENEDDDRGFGDIDLAAG